MPICKDCQEPKTTDEMANHRGKRNGRVFIYKRSICRECHADYRYFRKVLIKAKQEAEFFNQFITRKLV